MKKARCETLYFSYKRAQKAFSKSPCKTATDCESLKMAISLKATEAALRGGYVLAGCDKIDWGTGRNPQEKKESHWQAYRQAMNALMNCWKKWTELGCCDTCGA